jgi:Flp pilus assembly protein TadG
MKQTTKNPEKTTNITNVAVVLRVLKSDAGSSLVEYAIVFMVFLTMLLGIADFGRALYAYHFVSSTAREATRYAMVRGCSTTSTNCPTPASAMDIQTFVQQVPLGIDSTQVTAQTTWNPNHNPGSTVQVKVNYSFSFSVPFISALMAASPCTGATDPKSICMTSTSQMVIAQ